MEILKASRPIEELSVQAAVIAFNNNRGAGCGC